MKRHRFLLYPAGMPGTGLLILRASIFIFLLSLSADSFVSVSLAAIVIDMIACLVGLGLLTRTAACMSVAVAGFECAVGQIISTGLLAHILDAVVLTICGPGAFSLDAKLFGRTTVHMPNHVEHTD
jgi:hypothetical protein